MKTMLSKYASYIFLGLVLATPACKSPKTRERLSESIYKAEVPIDPNLFDLQDPEFGEKLESLFEMHGILLNSAIVEILNSDCPNVNGAYKEQLFESSHDIATMFRSLYGARMAQKFEDLLNKQVRAFTAYIAAKKFDSPELAQDIAGKAYHNGDMLIQFFSIYNPFFPYAPEQKMFEEHLSLEIDQVREYMDGRILKAQEIGQQAIDQLQEFARHLAKAVQKQIESQQEGICYDQDGAVYKEVELKYCCEPEDQSFSYYEQDPPEYYDEEADERQEEEGDYDRRVPI